MRPVTIIEEMGMRNVSGWRFPVLLVLSGTICAMAAHGLWAALRERDQLKVANFFQCERANVNNLAIGCNPTIPNSGKGERSPLTLPLITCDVEGLLRRIRAELGCPLVVTICWNQAASITKCTSKCWFLGNALTSGINCLRL